MLLSNRHVKVLLRELLRELPHPGAVAHRGRDGAEAPVLLPKSNVVTLSLGDKGSVIVRPSGTEPKVKLYLTAVDRDKAQAIALLDALSARMCEFLPKNA